MLVVACIYKPGHSLMVLFFNIPFGLYLIAYKFVNINSLRGSVSLDPVKQYDQRIVICLNIISCFKINYSN